MPVLGQITDKIRHIYKAYLPGWSDSLKRVGSMIEDPPIYQRMTARENLRYQSLAVTGRVNDGEIDQLLKLVDLAGRADEQPKAYSLGMKQRLGIAITLIGSPDMVILDEPANGLDPAGIREIRKLLLRLPETGTTVLVSSHQLAEVQQACEQLVILSRGTVIAAGSTQDILDARTSKALRVSVQPNEVAAATESLLAASCLVHVEPDGSLAVEPAAGLSGRDVNRILSRSEIFASSISRQQISLEQAFLQMTESEPDSPPSPVLATAGAAQ